MKLYSKQCHIPRDVSFVSMFFSQNSQITVTFYWDTKKRQLQKPLMRHFVNYPFQWHTAIRFLGQNTPATSARQSSNSRIDRQLEVDILWPSDEGQGDDTVWRKMFDDGEEVGMQLKKISETTRFVVTIAQEVIPWGILTA